jgi:hypothetical protein
MSTPIGDALGDIEHFATRITHATTTDIQRLWQQLTTQNPYHATNDVTPTGAPMSLATFEATIKDDVATGIAKAEELAAHLKTIAEQHLPELAAIQASPVMAALEGFVLPPQAEQFIADMVASLAAKYGTAKAADTPAEPAAA